MKTIFPDGSNSIFIGEVPLPKCGEDMALCRVTHGVISAGTERGIILGCNGKTKDEIIKLKTLHPEALVLVHPECDPEVVKLADYAGSTAGILKKVVESDAKAFIIGTESGIFHAIHQQCPEKQLILASKELICPNMKSITLNKVLYSIDNLETVITVPEDIARRAVVALEKMIELAS